MSGRGGKLQAQKLGSWNLGWTVSRAPPPQTEGVGSHLPPGVLRRQGFDSAAEKFGLEIEKSPCFITKFLVLSPPLGPFFRSGQTLPPPPGCGEWPSQAAITEGGGKFGVGAFFSAGWELKSARGCKPQIPAPWGGHLICPYFLPVTSPDVIFAALSNGESVLQ